MVTKNEITQRIHEKFPNWDFSIIQWDNTVKPVTILCNNCRETTTYTRIFNLLNKQAPCKCNSSSSQYKSIQQKQELLNKINDSQFSFIEWVKINDDKHRPGIKLLCMNCNNTFSIRVNKMLNEFKCPYCDLHSKRNTENRKVFLQERGYTLLNEYINNITPVLIRHDKCGFIWKTKMDSLNKFNGSCPHCNHLMSKGERIIYNYLMEHNIVFEKEKKFMWQSHKLFRYDFWVPDYNLIIEFNGRQHYEETNIFSSSLEENQLHDQIKKDEALAQKINYLIISFSFLNQINEILDKWFNDYPKEGVESKLMTFERNSILNKDENIV